MIELEQVDEPTQIVVGTYGDRVRVAFTVSNEARTEVEGMVAGVLSREKALALARLLIEAVEAAR